MLRYNPRESSSPANLDLMSGDETADKSSDSTNVDGDNQTPGKRFGRLANDRRKRILLLAVVGPGMVLITMVALWMADRFREEEVDAGPIQSPQELFTQEFEQVREKQLETFHLPNSEVTDEMVATIADLDWIETVILDKGVVSDRSLETISKLPNLQHLRLRLSPITDEGLKTISNCQSLWYLNLPHSDCTSAGVAELQNLKNLRQLRLGSKQLGNDVTEEIAKLNGLRGVHLIGIPITDDGLEILAAMPHLESLYLDDSAVTEAGWERLFRDHPDLHVHVNQRHHDRDPKGHRHHD
jgi:hypothetical protein